MASEPLPLSDSESSRRPRILVVAYHFWPEEEVGALRWSALTKYLSRSGWDVEVVTAASGPHNRDDVKIHRRSPGFATRDLYPKLKRRFLRQRTPEPPPPGPGTDPPPSPAGPASRKKSGPQQAVRYLLRHALELPDYARGWITRGKSMAKNVARDFRPDVVVSSGPPHSSHLVGRAAAGLAGVPHVMDLRDPWITGLTEETSKMTSALSRKTLRFLEKKCFRSAGAIVVNTDRLSETIRSVYEGPIHFVRNGLDIECLPSKPNTPNERFTISYVGTLYYNRDIAAPLRAFNKLRQSNNGATDSMRFEFAGKVDGSHLNDFNAVLKELNLGESFSNRGLVPRTEALEMTQESDIALVLAQGQASQIPAKLYECAQLGRRTLVLTEKDSATYREAERIGVRAVDPANFEKLVECFEDAITGNWKMTEPVSDFLYPTIANDLSKILEGIIEKPGTRHTRRVALARTANE